ncbi:MAG: ATP phosphoribosyltransferase [Chlorobi bacterium]|nr:ATP phosphoribosyltransferase [Chlorobiota bacterium]
MKTGILRLAVQKSGRLRDGSLRLLKETGIKLDNGQDQLRVRTPNFPLEILFLRNSDIPNYVRDGVADIAIVGENLVSEKGEDLKIQLKLGFARCRLSLAVPKAVDYPGPEFWEGKRIATSYPSSLRKFLDEHNINAAIHEISGSVEIAPNIGLADGICDLVSSGSTLFQNRLKEVEKILDSEAVLVSGQHLVPEKQEILDKLLFRLQAVLAASSNKYILLNAPNDRLEEITGILPGMKSPTIMPLGLRGWSSVHSVIGEEDFWNVIDRLKDAGAQGILVVPIEKMVR